MRWLAWLVAPFLAVTLVVPATGITAAATLPAVGGPVVAPWRDGEPVFRQPRGTPAIVGANYHGMWQDMTDDVRAGVLDRLAAAGVDSVRLDISWEMLQPTSRNSYDMGWGVPRIDQRIAEITSRGMKVLLLLYWAPQWSSGTTAKNGVPGDPADYGRAAAWAAQRWAGDIHAIELWNEPDLSDYLANRSVATYTALVKAAYPRIKAVNPAITVVAGAPTYVQTGWYERFYELGGAGHYDALGIHPYMGLADTEPATCDKNWIEYQPCNIPNLIQLMRANGDGDKTIWATEYGWSAHDNSGYGSPTPTWKRGVSRSQQADYLLQMQQYLAQWPQVEASFWYTDRDTDRNDPQEDNYGLLTRSLAPKPVYFALRCAAAGVCGPQSSLPDTPIAAGPGQPSSTTPTGSRPAFKAERTRTRWAKARSTKVLRRDGQSVRATASARRSATATVVRWDTTRERAQRRAATAASRRAEARAEDKAKRAAATKARHAVQRRLERRHR